jgi:hypothetical protein
VLDNRASSRRKRPLRPAVTVRPLARRTLKHAAASETAAKVDIASTPCAKAVCDWVAAWTDCRGEGEVTAPPIGGLPMLARMRLPLFWSLAGACCASPLAAQTTALVSVSSTGMQTDDPSGHSTMSANGRYVAFSSHASTLIVGDTNGAYDVFVHHRQTGSTVRVSVSSVGTQANAESYQPSLSADGRYVAPILFQATRIAQPMCFCMTNRRQPRYS